MNTDVLIDAQDLHTCYGASHILRGNNFSVARGETIGRMGHKGSGIRPLHKSTMCVVTPPRGPGTAKEVRAVAGGDCDGTTRGRTRAAPGAASAMAGVKAESTPPDMPISTPGKPFLPM